jgi:hypothetical protein
LDCRVSRVEPSSTDGAAGQQLADHPQNLSFPPPLIKKKKKLSKGW